VPGSVKEQKVYRILVDEGSAVNIIEKSTMQDLGIIMEELSKSQTMIQGFNLKGQRTIGMISVKLVIRNLSTSSIYHVIDAKISYKLLFRWPWLHKHGIVASTLHQCLKYYRGGERKINDNVKLFTKAKYHFV